jgi:ribonucleoside-diphosphate reductase alpha chain
MTDKYLPTIYQQVIAKSRYSRWSDELGRRETWEETVGRYMQHVVEPRLDQAELVEEIRQAILNLEVMPSMRGLMVAGPALERDHMALYNCSFVAMDNPRAFDEILYILTCGTGVGFSCETQYVNKLPEVAESFHDTDSTIVVSDSRIGWASSFRELIQLLYGGKVPKIDVSRVRGKGERLRTFGGRASGPEPLVDLFEYTVRTFRGAAGRRLSDIEVHALVCKIGEVVVVGGVRRSALISLSDLNSERMRDAKNVRTVLWHTVTPEGVGNIRYIAPGGGEQTIYVTELKEHDMKLLADQKVGWWITHPEFALANNSAVYEQQPGVGEFLDEWTSLYKSKSGERGIYYRKGIRNKTERIGRRDPSLVVGTNPCGEIALRSAGLCNLTEIVVRSGDDLASLKRKARIATILGTIQSTYTDFRYVRNIWKRNAEEERLLGVSLTGIYDNTLLSGGTRGADNTRLGSVLEELKEYCGEVNREYAARLGINPSVAISTVKPSGTVSQLVDSASGIHPRHSEYYIRSIRQDNKDPLTQFLIDSGLPYEPCVMKPDSTTVFYFPIKAPDGAVTRDQVTPRKHLDLWNVYNEHWAEHQVSVTVSVNESQWVDTAGWVYDNFDSLSGVSFLPMDGGTYRQAPYQECTPEQYEELLGRMPKALDWETFAGYEQDDNTTSTRELACTAGACEIL